VAVHPSSGIAADRGRNSPASPRATMNVFEVGNVIDDQEIPNGRFDPLVNTWLPNHLDSTGATAILEFNHLATG
jgi:hypothetical protein